MWHIMNICEQDVKYCEHGIHIKNIGDIWWAMSTTDDISST